MGSFQITYDDFSGGQYMGPRSTNWPKNTWSGENVISMSDGRLLPTGAMTAGTYSPGTRTRASILDLHVDGTTAFAFANWVNATPTDFPKMVYFSSINDGTSFPITGTAVTLNGTPVGQVAYNNRFLAETFYYLNSAGTIFSIQGPNTFSPLAQATVSSALVGTTVTDMKIWGERVIAYGGFSSKLYYSDTNKTTWDASTQFYEFPGIISEVIPRAQDLIVICVGGVFSLTGVLGSSVTNQNISGQINVMEGMTRSTLSGRTINFFDQSSVGVLDGHIYAMEGTYVRPIATMETSDMVAAQPFGYEQATIGTVSGERLVAMLRTGVCYAEKISGTWTRLNFSSSTIDPLYTNQQKVGKTTSNALNEYFCVASIDSSTSALTLKLDRFIHNVNVFTNKDAKFRSDTTPAAVGSSVPTGTVTLPEYFHTKPFTVKEMFVEYESTTASVVTASIIPTGNIDVLAANISSMTSSGASNITQTAAATVAERFLPNNANKAFGIKPQLSITSAIVKRVILNCED
jgi:hypothetical protein